MPVDPSAPVDPVPQREREWAAERVVGTDQAAHLIGQQFPRLRGAAVEPLATGWDNTVYLVEGGWVFRFPRRELALPGVRREMDVLPRLASWLPLPIPVPEFLGTASASYPWPFWGARLLAGRELAEADVDDAGRAASAGELGRFLSALHDPALVTRVGPDLPVDPMRRGDPAWRAPRVRAQLTRLVRRGVWEGGPAVERLLARAAQTGPPTGPPVVVHGDLHVRHLLVDQAGRASGVIDWGDLCLADPAVDLSLAYAGFVGPARVELLDAYGPVDPEREVRARVLAVFLCALLADYAAVERRPRLLREAVAGLTRATS